jgi:hypothetical protein
MLILLLGVTFLLGIQHGPGMHAPSGEAAAGAALRDQIAVS